VRIGFNARYMHHPSRRGFNRYTYSLAKALTRQAGVEVVLISEDPIHSSFLSDLPAEVIAVRGVRHIWWEQAILPRLISDRRLDVFHAPGSIGLPFRKACAYVLSIHDVIGRAAARFLPKQPWTIRAQHGIREWSSLRSADAIITGSTHAKGDIVRWLGVSPEKVTVIPDGAEEKFRVLDSAIVASAKARFGLARPYIFYVGGFDARKNVAALVAAYAQSGAANDADLVLAGEQTLEAQQIAHTVKALGIESRTRFLGYVADEDLPALYNGATLFVFPSFYEGFGLQLVEAMACGVPVIASNRSSVPEVLDGAGILVDPENVGALSAAIDAVFFDRDAARRLIERGLEVARHLSWDRAAQETVHVYRDVIARAS